MGPLGLSERRRAWTSTCPPWRACRVNYPILSFASEKKGFSPVSLPFVSFASNRRGSALLNIN